MRIGELYEKYLANPVVTTDSRNVPEGSLFFALRGDSFDGNRFAAAALAKGAAYAIVDDPSAAEEGDVRYIIVDNALGALQGLAAFHRRKLGIPVIAITGTNGKTTTKELATAVLGTKYKVHSTYGNLNNHIGVPLTLLSMPAGTELAIVEMGASAAGEISALCEIAAPDYGIITNIGRAHLEGFEGPEGVRKAKGELYDYLALTGGTALVRRGDEVLEGMAREREGLKTIFYDTSVAGKLKSNLAGSYNIYNIAAAAELGDIFDVPHRDIARAAAEYIPSGDRSRLLDTGRNVIISDCYNSNPSSMAAALDSFARTGPAAGKDGQPLRKAAILGDMLELGRWSLREHEEVIRAAAVGGVRELFLVGGNFHQAWLSILENDPGFAEEAGLTVNTFIDAGALRKRLSDDSVSGRFILLKGSRGVALESIISAL